MLSRETDVCEVVEENRLAIVENIGAIPCNCNTAVNIPARVGTYTRRATITRIERGSLLKKNNIRIPSGLYHFD